MKPLLLASIIAIGIGSVASNSWSDAPDAPNPSADVEPTTTGSGAMPSSGNEILYKDPFQPYGIGPSGDEKTPKPFWSYEDLPQAEKAVIDKVHDAKAWPTIHEAYGTAVAERAQRAAATSATAQLGVPDLSSTGVVQ